MSAFANRRRDHVGPLWKLERGRRLIALKMSAKLWVSKQLQGLNPNLIRWIADAECSKRYAQGRLKLLLTVHGFFGERSRRRQVRRPRFGFPNLVIYGPLSGVKRTFAHPCKMSVIDPQTLHCRFGC